MGRDRHRQAGICSQATGICRQQFRRRAIHIDHREVDAWNAIFEDQVGDEAGCKHVAAGTDESYTHGTQYVSGMEGSVHGNACRIMHMSGKLLIPTLVQLNPSECPSPVRSGGWHSFATAIHSQTRVSPGWHVIFQLDRTAAWTVTESSGVSVRVLRAGWLAVFPPRTRFQGSDTIDRPNAHAWLDLGRGSADLMPAAEHRALLRMLPQEVLI
jgi:hypothetical protein